MTIKEIIARLVRKPKQKDLLQNLAPAKSRQLALALKHRVNYNTEDFVLSPCNEMAFDWVNDWSHWHSFCLLIVGPEASGKTHLAHIWAGMVEAKFIDISEIGKTHSADLVGRHTNIVVDDIDKLSEDQETGFFHLFNYIKEVSGYMLVTSKREVKFMDIKLQDLSSRLTSVDYVNLDSPDEEMLSIFIVKSFSDRRLQIDPSLVKYILHRCERSFGGLRSLIDEIDSFSLRQKRKITLPLIKEVIQLQEAKEEV